MVVGHDALSTHDRNSDVKNLSCGFVAETTLRTALPRRLGIHNVGIYIRQKNMTVEEEISDSASMDGQRITLSRR